MNWLVVIGIICAVLILGGAAYAFLSDPEEVDHEELTAVRRETAKQRQESLIREQVEEEKEHIKEMEEFPPVIKEAPTGATLALSSSPQ